MFTTERAVVFFNEGGDLFCDHAEQSLPFFSFQVDDRPQVQFSRAGMRVMHRIQSMFLQDHIEFPDVGRKIFYIHCCIFNYRNGFFITGKITKQAQSGFAERPDFFSVVSEQQGKMIAQSGCPHISLYLLANSYYLFPGFFAELYHQNSPRISLNEEAVFSLFAIVFGAFEHVVIDQLAGAGMVFQGDEIRMERFIH